MENKMSYDEFKEQEKYCKENNTPEGPGCEGCPGEHSICADNIRNILGKLIRKLHPKIKAIAKSNIRQYHFDEADCDTAAHWTADEIINLITRTQLPSKKFFLMKKEHTAYVWEVLAWSFNKEDLLRDLNGLEDSEKWVVVDEDDYFGKLTEVV